MNYNKHAIADRIIKSLEYAQVKKVSALALELGVDESAISRWKKTGNISLKNTQKLCAVLDISMDWLILGRGCIQQHKNHSESNSECETISNMTNIEPEIIKSVMGLIGKFTTKSKAR